MSRNNKASEIKLNVGVLDPKEVNSTVIKSLLEKKTEVNSVNIYRSKSDLLSDFGYDNLNAVLLNIYTFGLSDSFKLINAIREQYPIVPICLIGSKTELSLFKGVPDNWKKRFEHYYKLIIDDSFDKLDIEINRISNMMYRYLMYKEAKSKLVQLANIITNSSKHRTDLEKENIIDVVNLALKALEKNDISKESVKVVPGIKENELQIIVKDTITKLLKFTNTYINVSKFMIFFGFFLILLSYLSTIITKDYQMLSFGGIGIAGIITSFVTNPVKAISGGAKQILQLQTSYFAMLSQINLINSIETNDFKEQIEKSKRLDDAINSMHQSLHNHF